MLSSMRVCAYLVYYYSLASVLSTKQRKRLLHDNTKPKHKMGSKRNKKAKE
jgi:hypothetical protein